MSSAAADTQGRVFEALAQAQDAFTNRLLHGFGSAGPPAFAHVFQSMAAGLAADPQRVREMQRRYYQELLALWLRFFGTGAGNAEGASAPDKRFSAPEWRTLAWFDYLRQVHGLTSRWLDDLVESTDTDAATRRKLRFYAHRLADAVAPSNYAATNPEAIKLALQTGGTSFAQGLKNLLDDTAKGRISMSDESAFEVGRNLATTAGAVVYQNELMQLLQYRPLTEKVHRVPLLIVPPCINKYYILDLQPDNSFVRHALSEGLTVFMVSWRNVSPPMQRTRWDDYLESGVMRAIEVAKEICAVRKINALGFCVGGTLLASALAVLAAKRRHPAASITLLASMLDFADTGDISVYVDEEYVAAVERDYGDGGILPGAQLAGAFASLRANDLVWHYVVNNYLKGRTPAAFDLLYWNSDSANLPGPMYAYYLRNMYRENQLKTPAALTMCGVPIELARIALPSYVLAAADDHIVPWTSAYASALLLRPTVEFVLGASGHIAGVVNPPSHDKRSYRTGALASDAQRWLAGSQEHRGSWWKHWARWIKARSGARIPTRPGLGSEKHSQLEAAPGSYVRERPEGSAVINLATNPDSGHYAFLNRSELRW